MRPRDENGVRWACAWLAMIMASACDGRVVPTVSIADAGTDAEIVTIEWDGGPECECEPSGPCDEARCVEGACVHAARADGSSCEDDEHLCVAARCVRRECGDGWREPGDGAHAREACDVGRDAASCDASCEPSVVTVESELSRAPAQGELAVAVDDGDRVLVLWVDRGRAEPVLRAVALDGAGATRGEAELAGGALVGRVAAVGMRSGFVVAWTDATIGVRAAHVDAALRTTTAIALGSSVGSHAPALARGGESALAVWADEVLSAQRWDSERHTLGRVIEVGSASSWDDDPAIAADGGDWVATWSRRAVDGRDTAAYARHFTGERAVGEPVRLALVTSFGTDAVAVGDGRFGVAWSARDERGVHVEMARLDDGVLGAVQSLAGEDGAVLAWPRWIALGDVPHALLVRGTSRPRVVLGSAATRERDPSLARLEEALAGDMPATAALGASGSRGTTWIVWATATAPFALRAFRFSVDLLEAGGMDVEE